MSVSVERKLQQITRIPEFWPGDWVRVADEVSDGWTRVRRVRSITCSITRRDQPAAVWHVHFEEWHPSVLVRQVVRRATAEEIAHAVRTRTKRP